MFLPSSYLTSVISSGGEVKHEELLEIKTDVFRLIHISQEEGVNITVNSVHPGLIMTNLTRHSMLVMMIASFSQRLPSTNFPWRSCNFVSEFSDIFDLEHVKKVSENDVQIVSSLPSTRVMTRPIEEKRTPLHTTSEWINLITSSRECVLLLRSLHSRLSKDLPSDLQ